MKIRLGTRGSKLALTQTESVAQRLRDRNPGLACELTVIHTTGDKVQDKALDQIGGKGVFVREIEQELLGGGIDLAVHSMKDMPSEPAPGLCFCRTLPREDPRDALILRGASSLWELPQGAVIATGSKRRAYQLLQLRPDLHITGIRGNVDTRLRKLDEGAADGLVMAAAGLKRLGLAHRITQFFDPETELVPACAQGALAVEYREGDGVIGPLLDALCDSEAHLRTVCERSFLAAVGGGCHTPAGAYARLDAGEIVLTAFLASEDGSACGRLTLRGAQEEAEALARQAALELRGRIGEGE